MGVSEDSVSHWGTVREAALGLISAIWEELANFKRAKCGQCSAHKSLSCAIYRKQRKESRAAAGRGKHNVGWILFSF